MEEARKMCLNNVDQICDPPEASCGKGWKVGRIDGHAFRALHDQRHYAFNVWHKCSSPGFTICFGPSKFRSERSPKGIKSNQFDGVGGCVHYPFGFHIYTSRDVAKRMCVTEFGVDHDIITVKFRKVVAKGRETGNEVVVAQEIWFVKPPKKKKKKEKHDSPP
jgi:hypothetical protein